MRAKQGSLAAYIIELGILLALMGSILVIAPMNERLYYLPLRDVQNTPWYFALPIIVASCAIYNIKTLNEMIARNITKH